VRKISFKVINMHYKHIYNIFLLLANVRYQRLNILQAYNLWKLVFEMHEAEHRGKLVIK
jgi:hypothetical protein